MGLTYQDGWISLTHLAREAGFKSGMTDKLRGVVNKLVAEGLEKKLIRPTRPDGAQLAPAEAWCVAPEDAEYVRQAFKEYREGAHARRSAAAKERFSVDANLSQPKGRTPDPVPGEPTVTVVHKKCGIVGCYNPVRALGLCISHWQQQHAAKGKPNALHEKRAAYAEDITKYAVLEGYKIVYENLANALRQIEQKIQENT